MVQEPWKMYKGRVKSDKEYKKWVKRELVKMKRADSNSQECGHVDLENNRKLINNSLCRVYYNK